MRAFAKRPSPSELEKIDQATSTIESGPKSHPHLAPAQDSGTSFAHLKVGQTVEVPPHLVKRNPINARRLTSQAGLDEFAKELKRDGQQVAAQAYVDGDGSLNLIAGHRRLESCILGELLLRVEIRPKPENDQELYLQSRAENTERENQTPLDDALAWKLLLDRKIFSSQVELASKLNVDPTVMSRTLGLADLPKPLMSMLTERPALLTLRMLDAIKKFYDVAGEEETEALVIEVMNRELSSRDVDARRVAKQNGPATRTRGNNQTFRYPNGQCVVKVFAGKGKMVLEVKDVKDEKLIERLNDELNKLVEKHLSAG
jgi:ParB family transcriptional regulator, chromosome partitioning protein